jgi:hypothetical protein
VAVSNILLEVYHSSRLEGGRTGWLTNAAGVAPGAVLAAALR